MKYLKLFKIFESNSSLIDIKSDIEDITLELSDNDIVVDLNIIYDSYNLQDGFKILPSFKGYALNIDINSTLNDIVIDTVERLENFCFINGFKMRIAGGWKGIIYEHGTQSNFYELDYFKQIYMNEPFKSIKIIIYN